MALVLPTDSRDHRPPRTEAVKVLGVDILRDRTVRDYAVQSYMTGGAATTDASTPLSSQSFLELLTSPQSVVITEKLARRRGYQLGSEIQLLAGDRVGTYVVRALLADQGPARVMDGSFVLMDIAAAQLAFDRLGRIDRGADEHHLAGLAHAHAAREALRSAEARDHPEADLGLTEARLLAREDEVAHERELRTAAEREAVDRRDHRERQRLDELPERVPLAREAGGLLGVHRRHRGDVSARDEGLLARAREDDGGDLVILRGCRQCLLQRREQIRMQRIAFFGSVELQPQNGLVLFADEH
jgi:hypothetical protein